jgi:hypothetical protein
MVIINYHRVFLLSRKERISKIKDTALWPDKAEELGFDFKPILKQQENQQGTLRAAECRFFIVATMCVILVRHACDGVL